MTSITIAVDAMGGDNGVNVVVPAVLRVLAKIPSLKFILVGLPDAIETELAKHTNGYDKERLTIHPASQVVKMDESPTYAMRSKKDSSMRVAINLVKFKQAQACVSAGNTGALMATARFVLKMLPGIDRPAIMSPLPTMLGKTYMLDLGANVDCTAEHLMQFGVMGSVAVSAIENNLKPKVGLLNVGSEAIKGTEQVKQAAERLASMPGINYIGFVEGDDIYRGVADVIVCDGFAGNVALKTSEGLAQMVLHFAKREFKKNWYTKLVALIAKPVLRGLHAKFDTDQYNGGSLLGLRSVVIKSHGGAGVEAFATAIVSAAKEVERKVPERIESSIALNLKGCEVA